MEYRRRKIYTCIENVLQSKVLFAVMFLGCVLVLYGLWNRLKPIPLPMEVGDILKKSQSYIVSYQQDCLCGVDMEKWLSKGRENRVDMVVVAKSNSESVKKWRKEYPDVRFYIDGNGSVLRRFSLNSNTTFNVMSYAEIIFQSSNQNDLNVFFRKNGGSR